MKVIGVALLLLLVGLSLWVWWSLFQVTLAAWGSRRAKPQWQAFVASPYGQLALPLLKWLFPASGAVFLLSFFVHLFRANAI